MLSHTDGRGNTMPTAYVRRFNLKASLSDSEAEEPVGREAEYQKEGTMATKRQSGQGDLDRREILILGLAGASALALGNAKRVLAAEEKGIERKVIKEAESMIPGFGKIRVRDTLFQPRRLSTKKSVWLVGPSLPCTRY